LNGTRGAATAGLAVLAATVAGCTLTPAPGQPRDPLPPALLEVRMPELPPATLAELHDDGDGDAHGCLASGDERVSFHLRCGGRAAGGDGERAGRARPLVLLVPILAGGASLMEQVALRVHAHGFDVAWCDRLAPAMKPGQRARDLDELFRRTVLHQRLVLRWLREEHARGCEQFVLGISLGGMVATVLAAHEPGLRGVALCLCGGDVAGLVARSSEGRVQAWRDWRLATDGVGDDHLAWELAQQLAHEPLRYAPAVATDRVLLVEATFDTVVPHRHHQLLWEALGRPARYSVPLGHYSSALALDPILDHVARHFATRCARDPGAPPADP
jgi:pimeloyl-ACP methyl ester carboxylesterase